MPDNAKTNTKLGTSMLQNLIKLRERKGELLIEDVGVILDGMAGSLEAQSAEDTFLKSEIEKMANYIVDARSEINHLIPDANKEQACDNVKLASEELHEVVRHTEEATNAIMDAADAIQTISGELNNPNASEKITEAIMNIYNACNFQDITGQRIQKVVRLLDTIEVRIIRLVMLFNGELPEGYDLPPEITEDTRSDAHLMSGPQKSADIPTQDDIDKLFDSL